MYGACQMVKSHRFPLLHIHKRLAIAFDYPYACLGLSPVNSMNDYHHFLLFVDDCTRF